MWWTRDKPKKGELGFKVFDFKLELLILIGFLEVLLIVASVGVVRVALPSYDD